MAFDSRGRLYLLGPAEPLIRRFDPAQGRFQALATVGGDGTEARQFRSPANLACAGRNLYVADTGNRRVQVFDQDSLVLRHVWQAEDTGEDWEPCDVTAQGGIAYILDGAGGRVLAHRPGTDHLRLVVRQPEAGGHWARLAVDEAGHIYLLDPGAPGLTEYDAEGRCVGTVAEAGDVRDRFPPPAVRLDHKGRFCLPASLARACNRQPPQPAPTSEAPLALCPPWEPDGLLFTRDGRPAPPPDPIEPAGPRPYEQQGVWYSQELDSKLYHCQWHRLELELAALPAGTQVVVSTYTAEEAPGHSIQLVADHLWDTRVTLTGQAQRPSGEGVVPQGTASEDMLVRSREGRYLWLRLELIGNGYQTPAVSAIRVHYPRSSYLQYLPAVFARDGESRWFLERFLSIFQTEWDGLEHKLDEMYTWFDPDSVPEGGLLEFLAGWLALPLEGTWSWEQKRRLLTAAPKIYARRGTVEGLRAYLQVYLHNLAGRSPEEQGTWPHIVEGFRERRRLMLARGHTATLGQGAPLWGPGQVGRLQLDVSSRAGEARLLSSGEPELDIFREYAHRFRVYLPAAWIRTATDEEMLCRALDAEKPAHTHYELCLVEPRFRIGIQSTVGLDTIIGAYSSARLSCRPDRTALPGEMPPPSRQPRQRLGYDTVLSAEPEEPTRFQLLPGVRLGVHTILA
jgi:phage tail-like protein